MERELVAEVILNGVSIVDIGNKLIEIGTRFDNEGWFGTRVEIKTEGEYHMNNTVTIMVIDKVDVDFDSVKADMKKIVGSIVDKIYYR